MAAIFPQGKQCYETSAGIPLVGGQLFTYDAGTTNPRVTYADSGAVTPNPNPVVLDARGEALIYWSGNYKVILKDSLNNTIWTVDNVQAIDVLALASQTDPNGGAGLIGFNAALNYVAGTLGYYVKNITSAAINFIQGGVGAVSRTLQASCARR